MGLYQKHRPKDLDSFYGNSATTNALQKAIDKNTLSHAILLSGPTGCGKTTLARIIANTIGAEGEDYKELDVADFRGIDTVRNIRKQTRYKPFSGKARVWVLDECHMLTKDAQNALLKALEDTPDHVYYILCTTDPQKLISTVRGRCQSYEVSQLQDIEMKKLLRHISKKEGEKLGDKEIYTQIIESSGGHPRNAIQILEQVLQVPEEQRIDVAKVKSEQLAQGIELCRLLLSTSSWNKVAAILRGLKGQDAESIRRQVLGYMSAVLLNKDEVRAGRIMEEFIEPFYNSGFPGLVYACYAIIKN